MRHNFIHIEEALNDRLIISHAELTRFFRIIFGSNAPYDPFTLEEKSLPFGDLDRPEKVLARRLLGILCQVKQIEESKTSSNRSIELKIPSNQNNIDPSYLPNQLWQTSMEYLTLRERARIIHTSKLWHQLTQNSLIIEKVVPFGWINDQLKMSYLLISNCIKKSQDTDPKLTIQKLRKKMRAIVEVSFREEMRASKSQLQKMLTDENKASENFVIEGIIGGLFMIYVVIRSLHEASAKENLIVPILLRINEFGLLIGLLVLFAVLLISPSRSRMGRKLEKISEEKSPVQPIQNLRDNLKEYIIPPTIPEGVYMWNPPKSKNKILNLANSFLNNFRM